MSRLRSGSGATAVLKAADETTQKRGRAYCAAYLDEGRLRHLGDASSDLRLPAPRGTDHQNVLRNYVPLIQAAQEEGGCAER